MFPFVTLLAELVVVGFQRASLFRPSGLIRQGLEYPATEGEVCFTSPHLPLEVILGSYTRQYLLAKEPRHLSEEFHWLFNPPVVIVSTYNVLIED